MSTSIVPVTVPTNGDGPVANISSLVGAKTVTLTGTFGGTYTFLVSHDGQTFAPVLTFSSAGLEPIEVTLDDAYASVRLRAHSSRPSNVSVTVAGELGAGQNFFSPVATFTSGGTSPVVDLQALFPPTGLEEEVNFICDGGFTGSVLVEGSNDGVLFNSLGVFQGGASSRPGVSQVLDFTPLSTPDKVRYVRATAAGSVTSRVTVTVGGRIPAAGGGGGGSSVADWSNVRYIFLDGDAGNDAHLGYIDAPAGTVFTPAQTAPVAVKTTHRVNQIRVPVGAGHMCVVLIKPRAGFAPYDLVAAGDGLGSDDRSGLSGYSLLHTRGSDLTNSLADRQQLGYVPSFLGPNPDGSFTIASVSPSSVGLTLELTGAVLPPSWTLPQYQLRWVHAGVTSYTAVRWGDILGSDPSKLVAWFGAATFPTPGDPIWLEVPGAVLNRTIEAASAVFGASGPALSTAGLTVASFVHAGCTDDPVQSLYTHILVSPGGSVFSFNLAGDVSFIPNYTDETGNVVLGSGPGLTAPTMSVQLGNLQLVYVSLSDGATGGASSPSAITADHVNLINSTIQSAVITGGSGGASLANVDHGDLLVSTTGKTLLNSVFGITDWTPVVTVNPDTQDAGASFLLETMYNLRYAAEHSEPSSPGIVLKDGNYTVLFNFSSAGSSGGAGISAGNGLTVEYNSDGSIYTPLSYASLLATGFEVVGRQKVTCRYENQGYLGDMLPCPRGTVMKVWAPFEGTVSVDVGTIVGSTLGAGPVDDTIVGAASAFTTRVAEVVGVTVTNTEVPFAGDVDNEFGYAVVASPDGQLAVVRRDADTDGATLVTGDATYLSGQAGDDGIFGTFSLSALNAASYPVGQVAPVGPRVATGPVAVVLTWSRPRRQLASTESSFDVASNTVLADVTDLAAPVEAGKTYRFRAVVPVQVGAGGSRVAMAFAGTPGVTQLNYAFFGVSPVALAQAVTFAAFGDPGNVIVENVGNGWWQVDGLFEATTLGVLSVQFAQAVSNPDTSSANAGSYLEVVEK